MTELENIGDEVRRRLRQTEIEDGEDFRADGEKHGRQWAQHFARLAHLRRLAAEADQLYNLNDLTPEHLAAVALADASAVWDDLRGVPERPDSAALDGGWAEGFLDGVLEVLEAYDE